MRKCSICGKNIPQGLRSNARYCSTLCKSKYSKKIFEKQNPQRNLNNKRTSGAVSELFVALDLFNKGLEVFRAMSFTASCDFAIIHKGKLLKIEVTTGHYSKGKILKKKKNRKQFDILAIVVGEEIIYEPEWDEIHSDWKSNS